MDLVFIVIVIFAPFILGAHIGDIVSDMEKYFRAKRNTKMARKRPCIY